MTDRNSPEEIKKRRNLEDPLVMYLVVKKSLEMSAGKTAAQCAHASQMLLLKYVEEKQELEGSSLCNWEPNSSVDAKAMEYFNEWLDTSFRKVVLVADDNKFEKVKSLPNHIVVVDAGLTEIDPGSETVIGCWPMKKSEAPQCIKKLQTLK